MKILCKKYNIKSKIWFKNLDGDVGNIQKIFKLYKKIKYKTPVLLISGGETTVKVNGKGKGGRNQEFALYFAMEMKKINPSKSFEILSAGTDGRDGPTNAAGGILNQHSLEKIKKNKFKKRAIKQ